MMLRRLIDAPSSWPEFWESKWGPSLIPGFSTVLGGPTGVGKTTLAMQIGAEMASYEREVLVWSLEMPDWYLKGRVTSSWGLCPESMWVWEKGSLPPLDDIAKADLLIIDYLQKMAQVHRKAIEEISETLRTTCREADTSILAISSVSRSAAARIATSPAHELADIGYGTTGIEYDAAEVWAYNGHRLVSGKRRFGTRIDNEVIYHGESGLVEVVGPWKGDPASATVGHRDSILSKMLPGQWYDADDLVRGGARAKRLKALGALVDDGSVQSRKPPSQGKKRSKRKYALPGTEWQ